jgi:hypothetical protein
MHFFASRPSSLPTHLVRLVVCALLPSCIHQANAGSFPRPGGHSASSHTLPTPRPPKTSESAPYLLVCLPPPLRFAEPVETTDPVSPLPTVIGPPHPAGIIEEIAATNQQAAMVPSPPVASSTLPLTPDPTARESNDPVAETPPPQSGIAILPDDTSREIRSDDVLLYFQFPSRPPPNDPLPRSSATYRQQ